VAEGTQCGPRLLTGPEPTSNSEQPSTVIAPHPRESALPGNWSSPSLPSPKTLDTTITQSDEGPEVAIEHQQLQPFSYALNLTATEAETIAGSTTSNDFDIPPFYAPYTACSALDGTLGEWRSPADPMRVDEGLNTFYNTPPTELLGDPIYFQNDTFVAENGTEPAIVPQPDILQPMFLGGSTREDATWLWPRLYERVVELTSHCKPRHFLFEIMSSLHVVFENYTNINNKVGSFVYNADDYLADTSTLHIERPELPAVNPVGSWQQESLVDVRILVSCALFYSAYHDATQGKAVNDHHYFKSRFLRVINKALQDPVEAVSDNNLAAIISMCMYEVCSLSRTLYQVLTDCRMFGELSLLLYI